MFGYGHILYSIEYKYNEKFGNYTLYRIISGKTIDLYVNRIFELLGVSESPVWADSYSALLCGLKKGSSIGYHQSCGAHTGEIDTRRT